MMMRGCIRAGLSCDETKEWTLGVVFEGIQGPHKQDNKVYACYFLACLPARLPDALGEKSKVKTRYKIRLDI